MIEMKAARAPESTMATPPGSSVSDSASAVPAAPEPAPVAAPVPTGPQERLLTVQVWGRGRMVDPIVKAFVSEHARERTVKRTASAWDVAFKKFSTAGRA